MGQDWKVHSDRLRTCKRIQDLENRSLRCNVHLQMWLESIDLQGAITAILQELVPAIPLEHLAFDGIYTALCLMRDTGPQSDITAKMYYH